MLTSWKDKVTSLLGGEQATEPEERKRFCEIGWLVDTDQAGLIYGAPRAISRKPAPGAPASKKGVNHCPAVIEMESKTFEVPCPYDMSLRLTRNSQGKLTIARADAENTSITMKHLGKSVHLMGEERWRDRRYPVIQVSAPYRFVTDEPVWMTQIPPYFHYREEPWPGLLVGGRFPIDAWPRIMMWAFEWRSPDKVLTFKRGEPWFYLRFETFDPTRPVRMFEAEMTTELRRFCQSIDGVTNYVNQTMKLFEEARARRPAKLLVRAERPQAKQPDLAAE